MEFVFVAVFVIAVVLVVKSRKGKSASAPKKNASYKPRIQSEPSMNITLDGSSITITSEANGNSDTTIFDASEIAFFRAEEGVGGDVNRLQFVLESGYETEVLSAPPEATAEFRKLVSAIQELSSSDFISYEAGRKESKPAVKSDGRHFTEILEYLPPADGGFKASAIVLDDPVFAVVDVETTGRFPDQGDRVVDIAIVKVSSGGEILDSWSSLINPKRKVSATEIHGLTDKDLAQAPTFEEISDRVLSFLEGSIFVAHNASFDYRFIRMELGQVGKDVNPKGFAVFDTMTLAKKVFPDIPNRKMQTVVKAAGIDFEQLPGQKAHSALTDAHASAQLVSHYLSWNRSAVFEAVNWPLVDVTIKPVFQTRAEFDESERARGEEAAFLQALKEGPADQIRIAPDSEVYFSGFYAETDTDLQKIAARWNARVAGSVTKSRCKLVVAKDPEWISSSLKNAAKWGIPIVLWEHLDKVIASE